MFSISSSRHRNRIAFYRLPPSFTLQIKCPSSFYANHIIQSVKICVFTTLLLLLMREIHNIKSPNGGKQFARQFRVIVNVRIHSMEFIWIFEFIFSVFRFVLIDPPHFPLLAVKQLIMQSTFAVCLVFDYFFFSVLFFLNIFFYSNDDDDFLLSLSTFLSNATENSPNL